MKKIYTTLLLVLIASLSFAQISTQTVKDDGTTFLHQKRNLNTASRAGAGSWWFSYTDDLEVYLGTTLTIKGTAFLQDSVATIEYTSGDGRPQFYSYAQVFDFTEQIWYDMYDGLTEDDGTPIHVPHIGGSSQYTIDSIGCQYGYARGTNVAASIVDTLVMTIIGNDSLTYTGISYDEGATTAFQQADIAYNKTDATIAHSTYTKFYQVKYPLTINDTTGGYYVYKLLPVTGFNNLTLKSVAVAFSFKSGTPNRTLASIVGTDINSFIAFSAEDPRSEFNTTGSTALVDEKSTSLNAMEYSVADPSFFLYNYYVHNAIWNGNLRRPGILVHATCSDCQWVGVKEADQKNISVRPNPTTDNFTVTLADNTSARVQLFNIVGQMVYNQTTSEATLNVNVNNLTSGVYMLKVTQNGKTYTSKVVVK